MLIGALEVVYEAVMGNLSSLEANTTLATRGFDFNSTSRTLRLEDGQTSINITAPIIDVSCGTVRVSMSVLIHGSSMHNVGQ